jgi:hypothetical protein
MRGATEEDAEYHRPRGPMWYSAALYLHRLLEALPYASWRWIQDERHPCGSYRRFHLSAPIGYFG